MVRGAWNGPPSGLRRRQR